LGYLQALAAIPKCTHRAISNDYAVAIWEIGNKMV
jgi:hypothetical protein